MKSTASFFSLQNFINSLIQYSSLTPHTAGPPTLKRESSSFTAEQKEIILEVSGPFVETECVKAKAGVIRLDNTVTENGVVYFELLQIKKNNDRGYDYERALRA